MTAVIVEEVEDEIYYLPPSIDRSPVPFGSRVSISTKGQYPRLTLTADFRLRKGQSPFKRGTATWALNGTRQKDDTIVDFKYTETTFEDKQGATRPLIDIWFRSSVRFTRLVHPQLY